MSTPPKKTGSSGEHQAVVDFKSAVAKMNEVTTPAIDEATARAGALLSSPPPPMDAPKTKMSGTWTITIRGTGPHHNLQAGDANRLSARFVRELRAAGHEVTHASFSNGSEEDFHEHPDSMLDPRRE